MDRFVQLSCFLCLLFVIYSAEEQNDFGHEIEIPQNVYNIDALLKRTFLNIKNSLQTRDAYPYFELNKEKDLLLGAIERLDRLQNSTNSTQCSRDIRYIVESLISKEQWALQMLDSWGKPGSGIMIGNIHWVGEYTECLKVYAPKNLTAGNFHGQYCTLASLNTNSSESNPANAAMSFSIGLCIPDSCSSSELEGGVLQIFKPAGTSEDSKNNSTPPYKLQCQRRERPLTGAAKVVVALLSMFLALAIAGSSITAVKYFMEIPKEVGSSTAIINIPPNDLVEDSKDPTKKNVVADHPLMVQRNTPSGKLLGYFKSCEPFLECFCVFKNGAKLLNTKTSEGELVCIHGIRFLSMTWVILGHAYLTDIGQIRNLSQFLDLIKNWPFQIVLQAFYAVDSFFVLSGFLLTYLAMQELKKNGKINWPYFYVHRYLRLTPVYMLILGFYATVYPFLGSGPFWKQYDIDPNCHESWWWNLLYINNFKSQEKMCMGWTWYLANDMQFFVISPIILITLWRWPKVGYSIVAALMCTSWISNFCLTYHFDLLPGMAGILSQPSPDTINEVMKFQDYSDIVYGKPYTRIVTYLLGMMTGYILFRRKSSNAPKHSRITLGIGWTIATTITLACTYGLFHQNPGVVGRSFFNTFSRTTWAIGLCWVIYVCLVDQGGLVNDILSCKGMIPLSRLTYDAYLIHPLIMIGYSAALKTPVEISHPSVVLTYLGTVVITYALSLPVALVFESPVIALEKLIRKRFSKQQ